MQRDARRRRRGAAWWIASAGVMLVVALIFYGAAMKSDAIGGGAALGSVEVDKSDQFRSVSYSMPASAKPAGPLGSDDGVHRSLEDLFASERPESLLGQPIEIPSLQVTQRIGDDTFFVRAADGSPEREYLVVVADPGTCAVERGQLVAVSGTVRGVPNEPPSEWGLAPDEVTELLHHRIYLHADRVTQLAAGD